MDEKTLEEAEHELVDCMMASSLSWRSPRRNDDLWVWWTKEEPSNNISTNSDHHISIQDGIKTALFAFEYFPFVEDVHIQFWAATTTMTDEGVQHYLTTACQPFALNHLTNEKLNQYTENRLKYTYVDEGEEQNLTDGCISRVFRRQLPEISQDMSYYSVKEYPERDLALGCGINAILALPVFKPSLQCCVGVLEFLFTKNTSFAFLCYFIYAITALQKAGLGTIDPWQLIECIYKENLFVVKEELKGAMSQVRKRHCLPLAKIWARHKHISFVSRGGSLNTSCRASDVNCREEFLLSIPDMQDQTEDTGCYNLLEQSLPHPLRVGHGPVGKVFHSDKPCFCRDVTQLSIIDSPMAHIVRGFGFKSCFAVCLRYVATGNRDYALEFFLPPDKIHNGDLHDFLSSILTTLKQHLKSFEVVTGDIENDLFTEIDNLTASNVEASMAKGKNVILAQQGNSSSGHETTSSFGKHTSSHTISAVSSSSGQEIVPSVPLPAAFAYEQISILTSQIQNMFRTCRQALIAQFQKLVDEYKELLLVKEGE